MVFCISKFRNYKAMKLRDRVGESIENDRLEELQKEA